MTCVFCIGCGYRFANQVYATLGFDWLMMFAQPQVHIDTVVRSLRMLVLLVSNKQLRNKFIQGTHTPEKSLGRKDM